MNESKRIPYQNFGWYFLAGVVYAVFMGWLTHSVGVMVIGGVCVTLLCMRADDPQDHVAVKEYYGRRFVPIISVAMLLAGATLLAVSAEIEKILPGITFEVILLVYFLVDFAVLEVLLRRARE